MWNKYPEVRDELIELENTLKTYTKSKNKLLSDTTYDLVNAGGKRLRPAFVILSSHFGDCDHQKVLYAAGAIELLHTATLIHDDIIDKARLRRGKPTISVKYGVDMAVYTGDFLFTKAILLLSKSLKPEKLDVMALSVKSICEGEVSQYQQKYDINTSIMSYLKRVKSKTALLFAASCIIGAELCNCSRENSKSLGKYGFYYGMAFQIKDDIGDFLLHEADAGKPVMNDIAEGLITLPVIYAMNRKSKIRDIALSIFKEESLTNSRKLFELNKEVRVSGGIEKSRELLKKYIDRGLKALEKLPDNNSKRILSELIIDLDFDVKN